MQTKVSQIGATVLFVAMLAMSVLSLLPSRAEAHAPTTTVDSRLNAVDQGGFVPISGVSSWVTANTLINTADAATVTNPQTEVTRTTTPIINRAGGTVLRVRMAYNASLTVSQAPIVKVFGRTGSTQAWQLLKSAAGNIRETLTTAATDVTDGTYDYTTPDQTVHSWDCDGCEQLLIVVETALAGTGTVSDAFLQIKFI